MIQLPPISISGAPFTISIPAQPNLVSALVLTNESAFDLVLRYGGRTKTVSAWTADRLVLDAGDMRIPVVCQGNLPTLNQPNAFVSLQLYLAGETVPGTYPLQLSRTVQSYAQSKLIGTIAPGSFPASAKFIMDPATVAIALIPKGFNSIIGMTDTLTLSATNSATPNPTITWLPTNTQTFGTGQSPHPVYFKVTPSSDNTLTVNVGGTPPGGLTVDVLEIMDYSVIDIDQGESVQVVNGSSPFNVNVTGGNDLGVVENGINVLFAQIAATVASGAHTTVVPPGNAGNLRSMNLTISASSAVLGNISLEAGSAPFTSYWQADYNVAASGALAPMEINFHRMPFPTGLRLTPTIGCHLHGMVLWDQLTGI